MIFNHLKKDYILADLIDKVGELPVIAPRSNSIYQGLTKSIVSQQLSTKAAATIYQRLLDALGSDEIVGEKLLAMSNEDIRSIGLSMQKATYIKEVAHYFSRNEGIEQRLWDMPDEEIIKELTSIKGVGVWTVQMLLIFVMDRQDVLPLGDLIVRKGIVQLYNLEADHKHVLQHCEEATMDWKPYRTWGSRYMWAAKDMLV